MTDSKLIKENRAHSVTQEGRGLTVNPSPLNHVKLELAIIFCLAIVLFIALPRIVPQLVWQLAILLAYGVVGFTWIAVRIHRISRRVMQTGADKNNAGSK
jgi:uncharacterized membrane protein